MNTGLYPHKANSGLRFLKVIQEIQVQMYVEFYVSRSPLEIDSYTQVKNTYYMTTGKTHLTHQDLQDQQLPQADEWCPKPGAPVDSWRISSTSALDHCQSLSSGELRSGLFLPKLWPAGDSHTRRRTGMHRRQSCLRYGEGLLPAVIAAQSSPIRSGVCSI